jgi:hypothetical protein
VHPADLGAHPVDDHLGGRRDAVLGDRAFRLGEVLGNGNELDREGGIGGGLHGQPEERGELEIRRTRRADEHADVDRIDEGDEIRQGRGGRREGGHRAVGRRRHLDDPVFREVADGRRILSAGWIREGDSPREKQRSGEDLCFHPFHIMAVSLADSIGSPILRHQNADADTRDGPSD